MLTFKELSEKKTKVKINPKVEDLKEKNKCTDCDCNQNPCIKCGVDHHAGPKSDLSQSVKENYASEKEISEERPEEVGTEKLLTFNELNRYGKETGKATGSINKRPGSAVKKGGNTSDKALNYVRGMIRRETGNPEGQRKKTKGEKGKRQYGDRKGTPADTIAKRRQSKKDAEALMRDTRGT